MAERLLPNSQLTKRLLSKRLLSKRLWSALCALPQWLVAAATTAFKAASKAALTAAVRAAFWTCLGSMAVSAPLAHATDAAPAADDPVLEAHMLRITTELRCLVCQNQTIADSHADLAVDLRRQVREMLSQGQTDQQVIDYMTARYGDFVLYRPPFKATTALLWIGPGLMAVLGLLALVWILRQRSRLPDDQFEPDTDTDADADAPVSARIDTSPSSHS